MSDHVLRAPSLLAAELTSLFTTLLHSWMSLWLHHSAHSQKSKGSCYIN